MAHVGYTVELSYVEFQVTREILLFNLDNIIG